MQKQRIRKIKSMKLRNNTINDKDNKNDIPNMKSDKVKELKNTKSYQSDNESGNKSNNENMVYDIDDILSNNLIKTSLKMNNENVGKLNNKNDDNINNKSSNNKTLNKTISAKSKSENIHKDHRSRLKNQFLSNGGETLTDIQILELLLFFSIPQKDTNPLAHELINRFGSVKDVLFADTEALTSVSGIKDNTATLIKLVNYLFRFISKPSDVNIISSVFDAKSYCESLFKGVDVEQFYVICLSKENMIKNVKLIQSGTSDEMQVEIRNITKLAIESKSNRLIITHNHPYGSATMSDEDCAFTYSLMCSSMLNGIDVVDHIIVGRDSVNSLASQNILKHLRIKAFKNVSIPIHVQQLLSSYEEEYIIN